MNLSAEEIHLTNEEGSHVIAECFHVSTEKEEDIYIMNMVVVSKYNMLHLRHNTKLHKYHFTLSLLCCREPLQVVLLWMNID